MYKTASKFLQNFFSRRGKLPGLQPTSGKGTRQPPKSITCPYCYKSFETTDKYHFKKACPVLIQSRIEIVKLQKLALANCNQWVNYPCVKCRNPIHIHVDWEDPQVICKECIKLKPKHNKNNPKKQKELQSVKKLPATCPNKKKSGSGFKLGDLMSSPAKN